jgi:hypothetical protein
MSFQPSGKKVLTFLLVASAAWIAIQAWRNRSTSIAADTGIVATNPSKPNRVVAYYFHVTARCTTCRMIQAYTEESLATGFRDVLATGDLEWRPVNIQRAENRHFVQDYQLYARSVVIARFRDGQQVEWKNLEDVWDLLESKPAFVNYVQRQLRGYLGRL